MRGCSIWDCVSRETYLVECPLRGLSGPYCEPLTTIGETRVRVLRHSVLAGNLSPRFSFTRLTDYRRYCGGICRLLRPLLPLEMVTE